MSPIKLPSEVAGLGNVISTHAIHPKRSKQDFVAGAVTAALGLAVLFCAFSTLLGGGDGAGFSGGFFLLIALAILGTAGYTIQSGVQKRDWTVWVCKDGLAQKLAGKITIMLWKDVCEVLQNSTRNARTNGVALNSLKVIAEDGSRLDFNGRLEDSEKLAQNVQCAAGDYLMKELGDKIHAGEQLSFGKLALSKQGVVAGRRIFTWDQIGEVKMSGGVVRINDLKNNKVVASGRVAEFPNAFVFVVLASEFLKKA